MLLLKEAKQYEPSNANGNSDESKDTGRSPKEAEGGTTMNGPGATANLSGANVSAWQEP